MSKSRDLVYIAVFFAITLILWLFLTLVPGPRAEQLPVDVQGSYDLVDHDFTDTVYVVAPVWESWPDALYEPKELNNAESPVPQQSLDYESVQAVTHRMRLALPVGGVYGITTESADYAMRVFVDGVEVGNVGVPGITREQTVPQEGGFTCYFASSGETTEIVLHVSNFVHRKGGDAPALVVGTAENIAYLNKLINLKSGMVFGCLFIAGLYHLAIFLLNRQQFAALLFAVPCLLQAFVSVNFLNQLFPYLNWQVGVRLEYFFFIGALIFLVLLIDKLFPDALSKKVSGTYLAICGVFLVVVLATDTVFFTNLLFVFQGVSFAMAAYVLVRLAMRLYRERTTKNVLAFIGIVAVALFSVNEALMRNGLYLFGNMPGRSVGVCEGMVFFVLCYALLLSIEQAEVNEKLKESQKTLAAAEAHYEALLTEHENGHPHIQLSDFGLTKREVEVALLLLDGKSRESIAQLLNISMGTVNFHCTNIYRKTGASGLAELTRMISPLNLSEEG